MLLSSKKQISIILPDLRGGGAERVNVNLANYFSLQGYKVDIVLLSVSGEFLHELHPAIRIVDLSTHRLRSSLIPLIRYFCKARPSSVLCSMWPLTVITLLARILSRVNTSLVVVEHTTWSKSELIVNSFTRWKIRLTMHYSFKKADGIVAVSKGAAIDLARFAKLDPQSITTIYNPVVFPRPSYPPALLPPAQWWTGKHYKVLAVGTLKSIKDYKTLISAFSLLSKSVDARLLILGEGECRLSLEQQICLLGLDDKVFMPGFTSEVFPYYRQADLFVLSSIAEGLGNVIIEALEAGTPVVSTDCPSGPREILCNGKYGRLVPAQDPVALSVAMEASFTDIHDYTALKARAQDFTIEIAALQYEKLLFPSLSEELM